ncbi:hypothetical protein KsCSTR_21290 [Candidatus Kuenenia stuttgartiensis]|uniref:Uncharacterized protein n=1 Tax=Kuenenia stuttgartiensis TaxID=174633 RepID=Q1Q316_KUEST|nr:hypothetical protein KsCSTR_21290 [Candidatus Kuenenia stuttgartiensis]CAJ74402.1 unknown protein [Candidatus Kuenenia stuttgartiensis]
MPFAICYYLQSYAFKLSIITIKFFYRSDENSFCLMIRLIYKLSLLKQLFW